MTNPNPQAPHLDLNISHINPLPSIAQPTWTNQKNTCWPQSAAMQHHLQYAGTWSDLCFVAGKNGPHLQTKHLWYPMIHLFSSRIPSHGNQYSNHSLNIIPWLQYRIITITMQQHACWSHHSKNWYLALSPLTMDMIANSTPTTIPISLLTPPLYHQPSKYTLLLVNTTSPIYASWLNSSTTRSLHGHRSLTPFLP